MFHITMRGLVTVLLVFAILFGTGGCVDVVGTSFGLGFLLGTWFGAGQTQATCFVNGTQVDCATVPESSP